MLEALDAFHEYERIYSTDADTRSSDYYVLSKEDIINLITLYKYVGICRGRYLRDILHGKDSTKDYNEVALLSLHKSDLDLICEKIDKCDWFDYEYKEIPSF